MTRTKNTPNCLCQQCGKAFFAYPYEIRDGRKTCSKACGYKSRATNPYDLWKQVDTSGGPESCWEWQGRTNFGYGIVMIHGRNIRVHRLSYELVNGPIPDGLMVRHKCDNRRCVNPDHLEVGTHQDNMDDMMERGRKPMGELHHTVARPETVVRGERNGRAKLTDDAVRSIHRMVRDGMTISAIARHFNVSRSLVRKVRDGEVWRHVTPPPVQCPESD